MPPVSANARPRCLRHTSVVDDVRRPSTSLTPRDDHVVVAADSEGASGVLASVTARELGVGMASCPWLIVAAPGQRINITLMDFAVYDRAPSLVASRTRRDLSPSGRTGGSRRGAAAASAATARFCREYAVVSEHGATKNLVVCSDHRPRTRLVYTSRSHQVRVTFTDVTTDGDTDTQPYFAIKYEGCQSLFFDVCR